MVVPFENRGYWAIILGGSSGLGLASAKKLARHGMNICIVHRDSRSAIPHLQIQFDQISASGVQVISINADAVNAEKQREIISDIKRLIPPGHVRCLLHSIARGNLKTMAGSNALTSDDFSTTISAMAISLYDWTKLVFDASLFSPDARILAFTSEGSSKAWPSYAAVSAAKAALESIMRNIALEFAPFGIRCNCILAGVTDTPSMRMIPGNEAIAAHSESRNPFRRLTKPEDVADVVYLLCTDEAAWINGAIIPADGGEHLQ